MAVFHGTGGGLTAAELADFSVFDQPNTILSADNIAELAARNDPQIHKVHDKMKAEVAKKSADDSLSIKTSSDHRFSFLVHRYGHEYERK